MVGTAIPLTKLELNGVKFAVDQLVHLSFLPLVT